METPAPVSVPLMAGLEDSDGVSTVWLCGHDTAPGPRRPLGTGAGSLLQQGWMVSKQVWAG